MSRSIVCRDFPIYHMYYLQIVLTYIYLYEQTSHKYRTSMKKEYLIAEVQATRSSLSVQKYLVVQTNILLFMFY